MPPPRRGHDEVGAEVRDQVPGEAHELGERPVVRIGGGGSTSHVARHVRQRRDRDHQERRDQKQADGDGERPAFDQACVDQAGLGRNASVRSAGITSRPIAAPVPGAQGGWSHAGLSANGDAPPERAGTGAENPCWMESCRPVASPLRRGGDQTCSPRGGGRSRGGPPDKWATHGKRLASDTSYPRLKTCGDRLRNRAEA